ncbi:hypothetical protein DCC81_13300 [Chitinophaga parva]|uniref:DUF5683 domain-containing protein n=1 Tax=Chitinophaga parva TaxID=2169414 RepID=A0A2T7BG70_9BACT|nr:DUF5683 domain-containing protein [Chitinophaga parva]PUZ25278.1 hypothetical protein DCC81_13300 [Chitinophaga parva]
MQNNRKVTLLLRVLFALLLLAAFQRPAAVMAQDTVRPETKLRIGAQMAQQDSARKHPQLIISDSARTAQRDSIRLEKKRLHDPRKAAFYSVVLPGLGQAYNHEYWKMPLVYAALGTAVGVFVFNYKEFVDFRNAYRIRVAGNPGVKDKYYDIYPDANQLKYIRDYYRQYVDYSVLGFIVVYGLNIVDATVFAHLKQFDVSPDLSMKVMPTLINNRTPGIAVRISLGGGKPASSYTAYSRF